MRSLVWIGAVALLVSCSRDNPLFDRPGGGGGGSDGMTGPGGSMSGTRGPGSGMASADGGSAGVTSAPPPTTGGPGGNTEPPPPTTQGETSPPDDTGAPNDCCMASLTSTPGCEDVGVEACVCDEDPACCGNVWDQLCVEGVDFYECGDCGTDFEPCCAYEPGSCDSDLMVTCACMHDSSCCDEWGPNCVFESVFQCGLLGCDLPVQGCCEPGKFLEPGCNDLELAVCVCNLPGMLSCCTFEWDEACAVAAAGPCKGCP